MNELLRIWILALVAVSLLAGTRSLAKPGKAEGREHQAAADALFTNGLVLVLKIDVPSAGMRSLRRDGRTYVRATVREGKTVYTNVLVRLKGGAGSYRQVDDKPGLTLKLDETNGPAFHGLRKLHLNNSVQDPTYLSEWLCGELFREAGVPAPRAAHALVELNGQRLGLYVLLESVNSEFLGQYFKNPHGNVYSQGPNADINHPLEQIGGRETSNRADLRALAAAAREPGASRLAQVLDLERFLSFVAMETILCHWDGYTFNVKNYAVYHDLDTGKMVFIPHDLDQMLRNGQERIVPQAHGMVSSAILRVPETRRRYLERVGELYTNVFVAPVLLRRIDALVAKLTPAISNYDANLAREFAANAANLKSRVTNRARGLAAQLRVAQPAALSAANPSLAPQGWLPAGEESGAKLARVQDLQGKPALMIGARGPTTASWRATVSLEPGQYAFEGLARATGVEPLRDEKKGEGAGLRISGTQKARLNKLVGDSPWMKLVYEFQVTREATAVELVCELRATRGEVWFDVASLRLRRMP